MPKYRKKQMKDWIKEALRTRLALEISEDMLLYFQAIYPNETREAFLFAVGQNKTVEKLVRKAKDAEVQKEAN